METSGDSAALTRFAKSQAKRLGFDLVGVTTAEPPPHLQVYQHWIASGRHGDMAYLERQQSLARRADLQLILPGCRSMLVLAANYLPPKPPGDQEFGRVAAYAAGRDYHDVLVSRMDDLMAALEAAAGRRISYKRYTDTGPLLEREFAQRAGLGWIGKNTCLISPTSGSYFFLAEILLDLELEVDKPFRADRCGSCTRCIQACPTSCILPDRTIDARKCISYLTIELRKAIPEDLRASIGEWIFGCDECQDVCPWNKRFARPSEDSAFYPIPVLQESMLERLLDLEEAQMRMLLGESPLRRARRRGLVRNAAVVAGNSRDQSYRQRLATLLQNDRDAFVRQHAAWGLSNLPGVDAATALSRALGEEGDAVVRKEIRAALDKLRGGD